MRWWPRRRSRYALSLALQGGGAHGAFTWGVLDALLEDGRLRFDGVSGTSAGAMNAVVLAHGLSLGGADDAREALQTFWQAVAASVAPFESILGADPQTGAASPAMRLLLALTRQLSPRQFNPFDVNPLRDIVTEQIDFERLRRHSPIRVFVAATRVRNGRLRVFRNDELGPAPLLASACLPSVHHAVEIDGEPYWDGAFSANPAVFPLIYECSAPDILLVLLSPQEFGPAPHSVGEVRAHTVELAFNATFQREMLALARAQRYAQSGTFTLGRLERRLRRLCLHAVEASELVAALPAESRLATRLAFLERLRDAGREHAFQWLERHHAQLGKTSTVDLIQRFG